MQSYWINHQAIFLHEQASRDQSVLDLKMANKLGWCAFSIIQLLGTIAVMSPAAWEVFVIFIPVTAVCIWYQVGMQYMFNLRMLNKLKQEVVVLFWQSTLLK